MSGLYLIALGSNQRHPRHGAPRQILAAALRALDGAGLELVAAAPTIVSRPLGPSRRSYANGAALVASTLDPPALLARLQRLEAAFGLRRRGARWRARVLDLDIVLWDGGAWLAPGLVVPHPSFRERSFVLTPARALAPRWRDPLTGLTITHLAARLTRAGPLPIREAAKGP